MKGDWAPPESTSSDARKDLSMERLSLEFNSLDIESQAYYILTRMKMSGGKNHPDVKKAIAAWTSNFRVSSRTAYVAASEGESSPASTVANSLILMAFIRAKVRIFVHSP